MHDRAPWRGCGLTGSPCPPPCRRRQIRPMMTISCSARLSTHDREKHNKRWLLAAGLSRRTPQAHSLPPARPRHDYKLLYSVTRDSLTIHSQQIPRSAMRPHHPSTPLLVRLNPPFPRHGCVFPSHAGRLFGGEKRRLVVLPRCVEHFLCRVSNAALSSEYLSFFSVSYPDDKPAERVPPC